VDAPQVSFYAQGQSDVATGNLNKTTMLHCYALAYAAYLKFCQTIHRNVNVHFLPNLTIEEVDG
jgi:hypothetical protein